MNEKDGIIKSCQRHSCGLFQDSEALTHFIPIVLPDYYPFSVPLIIEFTGGLWTLSAFN
jgi:hypothetical protein